jgi:hypothetical protein
MNRNIFAAIALSLVSLSCSSPAGPTPAPAPTADVTWTISPGQVTATCVQTGALCFAGVSLSAKNAGGLATSVTLVTATMQTTSGKTSDTATYDAARITTLAGSTRIPAYGTLNIPAAGVTERVGCLWSQAGGVGRSGSLTIKITGADDNGTAWTATATIPVA